MAKPLWDLAHGAEGIREDLRLLFGVDRESAVLPFVRLIAMKKRQALLLGLSFNLYRLRHRYLS